MLIHWTVEVLAQLFQADTSGRWWAVRLDQKGCSGSLLVDLMNGTSVGGRVSKRGVRTFDIGRD
jgi:hypothetical protein